MPAASRLGEPRRILVVEDSFAVAIDVMDMLERAGFSVIGPASRLEDALSLARDAIDAAILDIDLHGKPSYPVADSLIDRNVPVILATGYAGGAVPERYRHLPRLEKPFGEDQLLSTLGQLWPEREEPAF